MSKRKKEVVEISSDEENPTKVVKSENLKFTGETFYLNELPNQYPKLKKINIKEVLEIVNLILFTFRRTLKVCF